MADSYPLMFTGADREPFAAWLERCRDLGVASSTAAAVRLAVFMASLESGAPIMAAAARLEARKRAER